MRWKKILKFDLVTTRGGDKGDSFLYSGEKRPKFDDIFHVLGDLDELNSFLGVVRNLDLDVKCIPSIQRNILAISSLIATNPKSETYKELFQITDASVEWLEMIQYSLMEDANIPQKFILPGEKKSYTAYIDIARSIARRCERGLVEVVRSQRRTDLYTCEKYLNRLSDLLFVIARYEDNK